CRRRNQFIVDHKHHVHCSTLFDKLMGFSICPQQLIIALLLRNQGGVQRTSIVTRCFGKTCTSLNRTAVISFHLNSHRLGIVMPYWTGKNDKLVFSRRPDSQVVVCSKNKRPDVKGTAWRIGNPVTVNFQ